MCQFKIVSFSLHHIAVDSKGKNPIYFFSSNLLLHFVRFRVSVLLICGEVRYGGITMGSVTFYEHHEKSSNSAAKAMLFDSIYSIYDSITHTVLCKHLKHMQRNAVK